MYISIKNYLHIFLFEIYYICNQPKRSLHMDVVYNMLLSAGIIFISWYSMNVSQEAIKSVNQMNHQIQMMFVKS